MLATSKDNGEWDGKRWWWWKREYWGVAAVNIENVVDSDEELVHLHDLENENVVDCVEELVVHLHDLHFLNQVVFLPLSSVLLQENLDFDDRVNKNDGGHQDDEDDVYSRTGRNECVSIHVQLVALWNQFPFLPANPLQRWGCQDFLTGNTFQFVPIGFGRHV